MDKKALALCILMIARVIFISGCMEQEITCNPPYMRMGEACCLDENSNSICDSDEFSVADETTSTNAITTSLQATTTTAAMTTTAPEASTSTTTAAITTTTFKQTYDCVSQAGYNPEAFIYVHSSGCGESFVSHAEAASSDKNVPLTLIDIAVLSGSEIKLLECFYGDYYEGNSNFYLCPRILCPKTGAVENVDGSKPVSFQMRSFAEKCS